MARKKGVYLHKWDISILEQVASSCNIASNAKTKTDWEIFLSAIYDAIEILDYRQRLVLLLSQEIGMALVDIARILKIPLSTAMVTLKTAVDKLVFYLKSRSLTKKNLFSSKAMCLIYNESVDLEENLYAASDFDLDNYAFVPWFYPRNYLVECVYEETVTGGCWEE